MKRNLLIFLLSAFSVLTVFSQEFSFKFGKVNDHELSMSCYEKDTTASAVFIYNKSDVYYDYRSDDFKLIYNFESKIKVLKPEGNAWADVTIPFYSPEDQSQPRESIAKLEAWAYNLDNGKIVKTKLEKNYIFEEQINSKWKQLKFSVPSVKTGTVIEYKYSVTSPLYDRIYDMVIQQNIPVIYGNHQIVIPEYFIFNKEVRNADLLKQETIPESVTFHVGGGSQGSNVIRCNATKYLFTVENLPALNNEPYLWSPDDYKAQVIFELAKLEIPGVLYKSFTTDWDKIDEMLKGDSEFGSVLKMQNPYKEELNALNLGAYKTDEDRIRAVYKLLKSKISWNNQYGFYGGNVRKAIKSGTGTNAEINFVLISMLKDAGLSAYPVMISRRDMGILPVLHPSVSKLNTFIVGIGNTDSTFVYMDGSVSKGDINVIPPVLLVNRARVFRENGQGSWVDLSNIGKHGVNSVSVCSLNSDGLLKGKRKVYYAGQFASALRDVFINEKDSAAFIEKIQTNGEMKIDNSSYKGMSEFSPLLEEELTFSKSTSVTDDFIYVNPLIFPHLTQNKFIKEDRKLPIEFDFPYSYKIRTILDIPEGYVIEELPKSIKIEPGHGGCFCSYVVSKTDKQVVINYTFNMDRVYYTAEEYKTLREFWTRIIEKNTEMLVFKKVS